MIEVYCVRYHLFCCCFSEWDVQIIKPVSQLRNEPVYAILQPKTFRTVNNTKSHDVLMPYPRMENCDNFIGYYLAMLCTARTAVARCLSVYPSVTRRYCL